MIYIHPKDKIHTPKGQSVFKFSQYLSTKTPILRKSLLVIYYYLKEKKDIRELRV